MSTPVAGLGTDAHEGGRRRARRRESTGSPERLRVGILGTGISEGLLLATAIASFAVHESLDGLVPAEERRSAAEAAEVSARYVNQISLGLLAAVAITGIIDAQVRFRPSRAFERPRPLPPDVRQLDVSVGPGSIGITGRF